MATANADRNLLFGILALQMDFISREGLVTAMNAWVLEKSRPLGQLLLERGALTAQRHALVEALVREHLRVHGDDPAQSLAAVRSVGGVRGQIGQIADPDLQASLALVSRPPAPDDDATRMPETGTAAEPGQRFRVLRFHREGGLGQVFVARDEELRRDVALKQIKEQYADHPESRSRFVLEAEITGNLEHPGVVPVYGLGHYADGRPYYAMRFIQGDSLKAAIERFHQRRPGDGPPGSPLVRRRLGLRHLLDRFRDVCNAMAYAHSRGVLHRDLKPANVMLGPYGETLVVDWGLAKPSGAPAAGATQAETALRPASASGSAETRMGSALGTPQYMSPEQAAGRIDLLGPASDVYSLGATLYNILTGRAPFPDASPETVVQQVQQGDFLRPRQLDPGVPAALEAICLKAMALAPEARYLSARDLADDIDRWLADEPVRAWREPWTVTARRWLGRHRTLVTATAAVGLVALLILSWATVRLNAANGLVTRQLAETKAAREQADANLYVAQMNLAHRAWEDGRVARVLELLRAQEPRRPDQPDLRGFEWYYLRGLCHRDRLTVRGQSGVAFSPNGLLFAAAGANQSVDVWDALTGKQLLSLAGHHGAVTAVAFSPDHRHLASASDDKTIRIWDAERGTLLRVLRGHTNAVRSVAYSPDGKHLASAGNDHAIKVWDAETGKETATLRGHAAHVFSVAYSPDGKHLASGSADETVRIWDPKTGKGRILLPARKHLAVLSVAFNPQDGTRLVSGNGDGSVTVWDLEEGADDNIVLTLKERGGHTQEVAGVAYSPDGKRIASASWDTGVKVWNADDVRQPPVTFRGHTGWVTGVAFSPDGRWLASAGGDNDGTVKLWDAATTDQEGRTVADPPAHRAPVNCVAYDSASRLLASAGNDGAVKLWDAAGARFVRTIPWARDPRDHGWVLTVAFSPDGRQLAGGGAQFDKQGKPLPAPLRIWDVGGTLVRTLAGHQDAVTGVAFSGDGRLLASVSRDKTARVWDAATGNLVHTLRGRAPCTCVAFSPDAENFHLLAVGGANGTVTLWDTDADRVKDLPAHGAEVTCVAFRPGSAWLASAGQDRAVKLWDVDTGRELATLPGYTARVYGLAFSPGGRRLASAGHDGTVKIWDMTTTQEVLTLGRSRRSLAGVAFRPDGRQLAACTGQDLRLWDAPANGQP